MSLDCFLKLLKAERLSPPPSDTAFPLPETWPFWPKSVRSFWQNCAVGVKMDSDFPVDCQGHFVNNETNSVEFHEDYDSSCTLEDIDSMWEDVPPPDFAEDSAPEEEVAISPAEAWKAECARVLKERGKAPDMSRLEPALRILKGKLVSVRFVDEDGEAVEEYKPEPGRLLTPDLLSKINSYNVNVSEALPASPPAPDPQPVQNPNPPAPQKQRKLVKTPMSTIKARAYPIDAIKGILPNSGVSVLGGASGDGKSFLAIDLGAHIAFQIPWFGRAVHKKRPVIYFYLENSDGIRQRVEAWEKQNPKYTIDDECGFDFYEVNLDMATDVEELAETMPLHAVVIIDTMRKANPGINENAPDGMGEILARLQKLSFLRKDILIVVVHHVPKTPSSQQADNRNRLAGHYSLAADTDAVLLTERKEGRRILWIGKSREDEDGIGFDYDLRKHIVGINERGEEVSSMAVVWMEKPEQEANSRRQKLGQVELDFRKALSILMRRDNSNKVSYKDLENVYAELCRDERPELKKKKDGSERDTKEHEEAIRKRFLNGRTPMEKNGIIKVCDGGNMIEVITKFTL